MLTPHRNHTSANTHTYIYREFQHFKTSSQLISLLNRLYQQILAQSEYVSIENYAVVVIDVVLLS